MPQWRKLHLKIIDSPSVNSMPDDFTRYQWALLSLIVDKEGRGVYKGSWLKSKMYPMRDNVSANKVMKAMEWYFAHKMIGVYCVDDQDYFHIISFHQHQDTSKDGRSNLPEPTDTNSRPTPDLLKTKSVTDKTRQEKTREDKKESIGAGAPELPKPEKPEEALSPGQELFKKTWGVKFLNSTQKAEILALEKYPMERLTAGVKWAHTEGMTFGHAINALKTALAKWDKPKKESPNGTHNPRPTTQPTGELSQAQLIARRLSGK